MSEPQTPEGGHTPPAPEAVAGPASGGDAAGSSPAPAKRTGRRRSVLLVVVLGIVGALLSAGAVAVYLYDKATEPDRSTPVVSADAFLYAVLVEDAESRVGLYTCSEWEPRDALMGTRNMVDPEAQVSWDTLSVLEQSTDRARVRARIRLLYPGELAASGELQWTISLAYEDGWRVCAAERG